MSILLYNFRIIMDSISFLCSKQNSIKSFINHQKKMIPKLISRIFTNQTRYNNGITTLTQNKLQHTKITKI